MVHLMFLKKPLLVVLVPGLLNSGAAPLIRVPRVLPSENGQEVTANTFITAEVFPELDVFYDPPTSVILVGSRHPLVGRPRMSRASYQELRIGSDLRRFFIPGPRDLLRRWIAGREQVLESAGAVPLNTWDRAPLEFAPYQASAEDLARAGAENVRLLVSAHQRARLLAPAEFRAPDERLARATELVHQASLKIQEKDARAAGELARQALVERPGHPMAVRTLRLLAATPKGLK